MNGKETGKNVKLEMLRQGLTPLQSKLLNQIWEQFCKKGEWPITRKMFSEHGTAAVRKELSALGGSVVREESNNRSKEELRLTLLGIALTSAGAKVQNLLNRYFALQFELFAKDPDRDQVAHTDLATALGLSDDDLKLLGNIIGLGNLSGGNSSRSDTAWTVGVMKEVEEYPTPVDFEAKATEWIMRNYQSGTAVFQNDYRQTLGSSRLIPPAWNPTFGLEQQRTIEPSEVDPFKKRYQVFVSSTYTDLIVERQHVMQALWVSRCIPSGMEQFAAANMDQFSLIRQVIDECDYFVVIVAGRYGSLGPDGRSFTEMEFDYAVETKKPILGFFHGDIRKLLGEKLEELDERRRKLDAFTEKVKHQRLCSRWTTPDGLESAIKTAITNAIESDPKPGWVRASSVPTWGMVKGLQKRIDELETQAASMNF